MGAFPLGDLIVFSFLAGCGPLVPPNSDGVLVKVQSLSLLSSLAFPSHDPSRTTLRGGGGAAKTASIQNSMLSTPKLPYFQILSSSSPPCTVAHTYIHTSFQPTNPFVGFPPPLVSPHAVLIPRTTSPPSFLAPRIRFLLPLSPHTLQCSTERDHPR